MQDRTIRNYSTFRRDLTMLSDLMRSLPPSLTVVFVLSVIGMNFLSRITLISLPFFAMNAGLLVSWVSFLVMDVVTRHYGARAASLLSLVAIAANLVCCLVCVVLSRLFSYPALDMVVGGQWSILTASTIAYILSAFFNNYANVYLARFFRTNPDGKAAYATRSLVSTWLSQSLDNFAFVFLAFVVFPNIPGALQVRWTIPQCVGAALIGAVFELASEAIVSPLGYHIVNAWKREDVGREFLDTYHPKVA